MVRTKGTKATKGSTERAKRKICGEGAVIITKLADQKLRQEGRKVLGKLMNNALHGNTSCARLLLDLSEKSRSAKACDRKRSGFSLANSWSAEPEWAGESSEAVAEMASGSREPEG